MLRRTCGLLALASIGLLGCTSEITDLVECTMVCEHYDDCVDDAYDTTQCADACEDMADRSEAFADRVRVCDECIDDVAECSARTQCDDECNGIIPSFSRL